MRNAYVLQCDISKFYPSMHHASLKREIRRKIKDRRTLLLLDDIIDSFPGPTNLPIGNLTSQWAGNVYLHALDMFCKHELKVRDYVRYCDDFLCFSDSKEQLRTWRDQIETFLAERLCLRFSRAELFPTSTGVDYVGYRHFPAGFILLRKSTAKRVIKKTMALDRIETTEEYRRSYLASVHGWMKHANCHNLAVSIGLPERMAEAGIRA